MFYIFFLLKIYRLWLKNSGWKINIFGNIQIMGYVSVLIAILLMESQFGKERLVLIDI